MYWTGTRNGLGKGSKKTAGSSSYGIGKRETPLSRLLASVANTGDTTIRKQSPETTEEQYSSFLGLGLGFPSKKSSPESITLIPSSLSEDETPKYDDINPNVWVSFTEYKDWISNQDETTVTDLLATLTKDQMDAGYLEYSADKAEEMFGKELRLAYEEFCISSKTLLEAEDVTGEEEGPIILRFEYLKEPKESIFDVPPRELLDKWGATGLWVRSMTDPEFWDSENVPTSFTSAGFMSPEELESELETRRKMAGRYGKGRERQFLRLLWDYFFTSLAVSDAFHLLQLCRIQDEDWKDVYHWNSGRNMEEGMPKELADRVDKLKREAEARGPQRFPSETHLGLATEYEVRSSWLVDTVDKIKLLSLYCVGKLSGISSSDLDLILHNMDRTRENGDRLLKILGLELDLVEPDFQKEDETVILPETVTLESDYLESIRDDSFSKIARIVCYQDLSEFTRTVCLFHDSYETRFDHQMGSKFRFSYDDLSDEGRLMAMFYVCTAVKVVLSAWFDCYSKGNLEIFNSTMGLATESISGKEAEKSAQQEFVGPRYEAYKEGKENKLKPTEPTMPMTQGELTTHLTKEFKTYYDMMVEQLRLMNARRNYRGEVLPVPLEVNPVNPVQTFDRFMAEMFKHRVKREKENYRDLADYDYLRIQRTVAAVLYGERAGSGSYYLNIEGLEDFAKENADIISSYFTVDSQSRPLIDRLFSALLKEGLDRTNYDPESGEGGLDPTWTYYKAGAQTEYPGRNPTFKRKAAGRNPAEDLTELSKERASQLNEKEVSDVLQKYVTNKVFLDFRKYIERASRDSTTGKIHDVLNKLGEHLNNLRSDIRKGDLDPTAKGIVDTYEEASKLRKQAYDLYFEEMNRTTDPKLGLPGERKGQNQYLILMRKFLQVNHNQKALLEQQRARSREPGLTVSNKLRWAGSLVAGAAVYGSSMFLNASPEWGIGVGLATAAAVGSFLYNGFEKTSKEAWQANVIVGGAAIVGALGGVASLVTVPHASKLVSTISGGLSQASEALGFEKGISKPLVVESELDWGDSGAMCSALNGKLQEIRYKFRPTEGDFSDSERMLFLDLKEVRRMNPGANFTIIPGERWNDPTTVTEFNSDYVKGCQSLLTAYYDSVSAALSGSTGGIPVGMSKAFEGAIKTLGSQAKSLEVLEIQASDLSKSVLSEDLSSHAMKTSAVLRVFGDFLTEYQKILSMDAPRQTKYFNHFLNGLEDVGKINHMKDYRERMILFRFPVINKELTSHAYRAAEGLALTDRSYGYNLFHSYDPTLMLKGLYTVSTVATVTAAAVERSRGSTPFYVFESVGRGPQPQYSSPSSGGGGLISSIIPRVYKLKSMFSSRNFIYSMASLAATQNIVPLLGSIGASASGKATELLAKHIMLPMMRRNRIQKAPRAAQDEEKLSIRLLRGVTEAACTLIHYANAGLVATCGRSALAQAVCFQLAITLTNGGWNYLWNNAGLGECLAIVALFSLGAFKGKTAVSNFWNKERKKRETENRIAWMLDTAFSWTSRAVEFFQCAVSFGGADLLFIANSLRVYLQPTAPTFTFWILSTAAMFFDFTVTLIEWRIGQVEEFLREVELYHQYREDYDVKVEAWGASPSDKHKEELAELKDRYQTKGRDLERKVDEKGSVVHPSNPVVELFLLWMGDWILMKEKLKASAAEEFWGKESSGLKSVASVRERLALISTGLSTLAVMTKLFTYAETIDVTDLKKWIKHKTTEGIERETILGLLRKGDWADYKVISTWFDGTALTQLLHPIKSVAARSASDLGSLGKFALSGITMGYVEAPSEWIWYSKVGGSMTAAMTASTVYRFTIFSNWAIKTLKLSWTTVERMSQAHTAVREDLAGTMR